MSMWDELEEILLRMEGEEKLKPDSPEFWEKISPFLNQCGLSREEFSIAIKLTREAALSLPSWEHRNIVLVLLSMAGNTPPLVHPASLLQAFSLGMAYQRLMSGEQN